MLEFFTNPGYLAAAGALVSAPIIIHLINRMRFKRIRWAAMEFLLKSQKRNRRRLIIEQLLLLLLRILLVLLAAFILARFIGIFFGGRGAVGQALLIAGILFVLTSLFAFRGFRLRVQRDREDPDIRKLYGTPKV